MATGRWKRVGVRVGGWGYTPQWKVFGSVPVDAAGGR